MDSVLAVLATTADIEHLEETLQWEPLLLPNKARQIDRIEILDVTRNEISTSFYVQEWKEIANGLALPVGISVDHYLDPLRPKESLTGDIAQKLFGVRHRAAMHMRNEAHWHSLSTWLEIESDAGHEQMASECAVASAELRNDYDWRKAAKLLHESFRGWHEPRTDQDPWSYEI